jgi:hypothetical protein
MTLTRKTLLILLIPGMLCYGHVPVSSPAAAFAVGKRTVLINANGGVF